MSMKKIYFLVITLYFTISTVKGQTQYQYCPDTSCISILFDGTSKLDSSNSKFILDFKNKWKYRKADSVVLMTKGSLFNTTNINSRDSINLQIVLVGKRHIQKIYAGSIFTVAFRTSARIICNTKSIIFQVKFPIHSPLIVYLDSIDISIIKKASN